MKGPRELKRYVALMRKHFKKRGRKNGHIPNYAWDDLTIFKLTDTCKKRKRKEKHKTKY